MLKEEKIDMTASRLLFAASLLEAIIGVALFVSPDAVARLLLDAELHVPGIAVARVAGIALLSLGVVCWMGRSDVNKTVSIAVMLTYNLLVTAYLLYLGLAGQLVGILLWPVIALHALFTLLFAYAWSNDREPKQRRLR